MTAMTVGKADLPIRDVILGCVRRLHALGRGVMSRQEIFDLTLSERPSAEPDAIRMAINAMKRDRVLEARGPHGFALAARYRPAPAPSHKPDPKPSVAPAPSAKPKPAAKKKAAAKPKAVEPAFELTRIEELQDAVIRGAVGSDRDGWWLASAMTDFLGLIGQRQPRRSLDEHESRYRIECKIDDGEKVCRLAPAFAVFPPEPIDASTPEEKPMVDATEEDQTLPDELQHSLAAITETLARPARQSVDRLATKQVYLRVLAEALDPAGKALLLEIANDLER